MAGITRKQFCSGLLGGGVLLWLSGCGGDDSAELNQLDGNVRISENHGHVLFIPDADLQDVGGNPPADKTYQLSVALGHTHLVTFTGFELQNIRAHQTVTSGSGPGVSPDDLVTVIDARTHSVTANPVQG